MAIDPRRPTDGFPRASAVAGLIANALGWRHRDADLITGVQDALDYAAREDREPVRVWDFQTADLSRLSGWTRWGRERPGGGSAAGTHILNKEYLADGAFTLALGLRGGAPIELEEVEAALLRPARPLFLGRKSCIPSSRILRGRVEAATALEAVRRLPLHSEGEWPETGLRVWWEGEALEKETTTREVWDRRNYSTTRFDRSRRIHEARVHPLATEESHA